MKVHQNFKQQEWKVRISHVSEAQALGEEERLFAELIILLFAELIIWLFAELII